MSARRARRLPAKVRPFRRIVSPVERSAGTRPRKDISCLGVSNRRTSPISAAKVTATRNEAPRIGFYDRRHRPLRHDESELSLEATQALERIFDRVNQSAVCEPKRLKERRYGIPVQGDRSTRQDTLIPNADLPWTSEELKIPHLGEVATRSAPLNHLLCREQDTGLVGPSASDPELIERMIRGQDRKLSRR